jgi:16S rRNA (cytosine1402-N4)-methyltransferase
MQHTSVLPVEVCDFLNLSHRHVIVDATLGLGGHSLSFFTSPAFTGSIVGFDQDEHMLREAVSRLMPYSHRFQALRCNFSGLKKVVEEDGLEFDGILFDLGVASPHFDNAERGFSYSSDSDLDMRLDTSSARTAADVVDSYPEADLVSLFSSYGEEPLSKTIAAAIVRRRRERPFVRTLDLADLISSVYKRKFGSSSSTHPATRVFQALRIEVNAELSVLRTALEDAIHLIQPGGRIIVISYHSLEDRIVKQLFSKYLDTSKTNKYSSHSLVEGGDAALLRLLTKRPIVPTADEILGNPRARSAKMRVAEKL